MSRIAEAWKRVSGTDPGELTIAAPGAEVSEPDRSALHQYPQENQRSRVRTDLRDRQGSLAPRPRPEPRDQPQRPDRPLAFDPVFARKLPVNENPTFGALGHYRRLARALHGLQTDAGLNRLMVTSARPGEGRTFTVTNVALALSEFFKQRVLLIDADVRSPSIAARFRLAGEPGLSDVLLAKCEDLPLHAVSTNLAVMAAGSPDPNTMAALTSDRMEWLIGQFASHFDWVLLDAAPVEFMTDAQLLARLTGSVLFVIGAASTPRRHVERAIASLGPESIVGTVLNRVRGENLRLTPCPTVQES
jgi:capsular exopolysaccharide synthesis family protein